MTINEEEIDNLKVVKRNGKKVSFDTAKVAIAIKKGFDGTVHEEEESKYSAKDVQKVYQSVIKEICKKYKDAEKIKIEEIQDLIEEMLKKNKYDLCLCFFFCCLFRKLCRTAGAACRLYVYL